MGATLQRSSSDIASTITRLSGSASREADGMAPLPDWNVDDAFVNVWEAYPTEAS